jgi:hypothetical protein
MFRRTAALLLSGFMASAALAQAAAPAVFHVDLAVPDAAPVSGRLLLFAVDAKAARAEAKDGKVSEVDASPFQQAQSSIAAREVTHLVAGQGVDIDADELAYPAAFSKLPPGDYLVQAVLDRNHDYNYGGRGAGDVISDVVEVKLPAASIPTLHLVGTVPMDGDMWTPPTSTPAAIREQIPAMRKVTHAIDFVSPSLSAFWGRPIPMKGWVLTPPGYDPTGSQRYPVVYYTHGFTGNLRYLLRPALGVYTAMQSGKMPPMIWVFLDESSATGTHEFADSVNNGP